MDKTAINTAVSLLSRREHSGEELRQKLKGRFEDDEIEAALTYLTKRGLLCEKRFAVMYIKTNAKKFGRARLRYELQQRGVGEKDINEAMTEEIVEDEVSRAVAVLDSKYGEVALDDAKLAQAAQFMNSRGFEESDAISAIEYRRRRADKGE
ncbi:MAG: regulatory protein RecX [Gammaproteobacteria bacterium WSBS_2016_MAG_OTU1]